MSKKNCEGPPEEERTINNRFPEASVHHNLRSETRPAVSARALSRTRTDLQPQSKRRSRQP
jgi:hypothetical protein